MITEETVRHVAKLARLDLDDAQLGQYTEELGKILTLVDELSALDLSDDSLALSAEYPTQFRADGPAWTFERDELMQNAPQAEDGFFRVPRILEE